MKASTAAPASPTWSNRLVSAWGQPVGIGGHLGNMGTHLSICSSLCSAHTSPGDRRHQGQRAGYVQGSNRCRGQCCGLPGVVPSAGVCPQHVFVPTEPQYFRFEGVWLTETGMAVLRNLSLSPLHKRRQRKGRPGALNGDGALEGADPLGPDDKKDGDLDADELLKAEGAFSHWCAVWGCQGTPLTWCSSSGSGC